MTNYNKAFAWKAWRVENQLCNTCILVWYRNTSRALRAQSVQDRIHSEQTAATAAALAAATAAALVAAVTAAEEREQLLAQETKSRHIKTACLNMICSHSDISRHAKLRMLTHWIVHVSEDKNKKSMKRNEAAHRKELAVEEREKALQQIQLRLKNKY